VPRKTRSRLVPMVVLPVDSRTPPEPHEVEVAWILARHFGVVVEFLRPSEGYKMRVIGQNVCLAWACQVGVGVVQRIPSQISSD